MKIIFTSIFVCLSFLTYSQLSSGLVGHWHMDGSADDLTGKHKGKFVGNTSPSEDHLGNIGCGMSFAMDSISYMSVSSKIQLDTTKDVSFSFWTKNEYIDNVTKEGQSSFYATYDKNFIQVSANKVTYGFPGISEHNNLYPPIMSARCTLQVLHTDIMMYNQPYIYYTPTGWSHIVMIISGTSKNGEHSLSTYVNGESQQVWGSKINYQKLSYPFSLFRIGFGYLNTAGYYAKDFKTYIDAISNGEFKMNQLLDDFRIYNRGLSQNEVGELYSLPSTCKVTSLENVVAIENAPKKVIKAVNLLGQEIDNLATYIGIAILIYSDNTKEKIVK